jgi:uncharacterized protein (TIGR01777 family)
LRILISGGTGFIGSSLAPKLIQQGHKVTILSRQMRPPRELLPGTSVIVCDSTLPGDWQKRVGDHDLIINLAGASIFRWWDAAGRRLIEDSRILTTRNLVEGLAHRQNRETQLLSISGIGYYGHQVDKMLDETDPPGDGFLADVSEHWEEAAFAAREYGVRVVVCRLGHVLGRSGGMLPKLITLSKLRLGSKWGTGQQWVSWVHVDDLISTLIFLGERKDIEGPINITSPNPVRNYELMELLNRFLHTNPLVPPIPALALRLALGDFASVFLNGQRVLPRKLVDSGYDFMFPTLHDAFAGLFATR